jgi:hypothetical protein
MGVTVEDNQSGNVHRLTLPGRYLLHMAIFLILVGFVVLILYRQIMIAFMANPALNGLIAGVLLIGCLLGIRQVVRLFREVRWVNGLSRRDMLDTVASPRLLAPVAAMLGENAGQASFSTATLRSLLDSVGMRLDESRDVLRYLTGLLVFLGLLGTFWGLLETVGSVGNVIQSMGGGSGDVSGLFDQLKTGLAAPLGGMSISFSSSLFGLAGSLILGFLDLQAGQAQNRFFNEFEDWLSARTNTLDIGNGGFGDGRAAADLRPLLDRLSQAIGDGAPAKASATATAHLAEGIQGLVQHMRNEQQMIRDWVEAQAAQQREVKGLLERLANGLDQERQQLEREREN